MKKVLKDENGKRIHPYVPELCEQLRKGEIERRDFLRTVALLGVSATSAYALAGRITGQQVVPEAAAQEPKRGGRLRFGMQVQEMTDPATFSWTEKSNVARQIVEYMFFNGMTQEQVADLLHVSTRTVEREWKKAKLFLYRAVHGDTASSGDQP